MDQDAFNASMDALIESQPSEPSYLNDDVVTIEVSTKHNKTAQQNPPAAERPSVNVAIPVQVVPERENSGQLHTPIRSNSSLAHHGDASSAATIFPDPRDPRDWDDYYSHSPMIYTTPDRRYLQDAYYSGPRSAYYDQRHYRTLPMHNPFGGKHRRHPRVPEEAPRQWLVDILVIKFYWLAAFSFLWGGLACTNLDLILASKQW